MTTLMKFNAPVKCAVTCPRYPAIARRPSDFNVHVPATGLTFEKDVVIVTVIICIIIQQRTAPTNTLIKYTLLYSIYLKITGGEEEI